MAYGSFEELEVWQRAKKLTVELFGLFKDSRDFVLKDQILKAALSIPSNIAEGSERGSTADYIRFLRIAKGSAGELRTQIYVAAEIGVNIPQKITKEIKEISCMIQGLINSLQDPNR